MLRRFPASILGMSLLCFCACTSTTFTSTWKAPDGQAIDPVGKTIAAVFVSGDERNRHTAEDALAKDLNARGADGVPGYTLLSNETRGDADDRLARLKEAGADEVVVMRVVGADKQPTVTQVGDSYGPGTNPAVLQHIDTLVSVETSVYSLDRDQLMWSSTSRTINPKDLVSLVNEVADATTKEMVKQGLLARQ